MRKKFKEQGYLTFAQGEQYLTCAYLLALSVKTYCDINDFTVVVDESTKVPSHMYKVFDQVITIPTMKPFENECLAWELTPYKETIKVESDMIITSNIDHWWHSCRLKNVCLTSRVKNYKNKFSDDGMYRSFWQENNLVNGYNGFMYFRHCVETKEFFQVSKRVFDNYSIYRDKVLTNCRHNDPDTDIVFSIAATEIEPTDFFTNLDCPTFTHMKKDVGGFDIADWRDSCSWALTEDMIFLVNGYAQTVPFHYFQKDFASEELISRYERSVFSSSK